MRLKVLQQIGKTLLREVPKIGVNGLISIGAGGDKTFPIDRKAEEIIISGLEKADEPLSIISEEAGLIELKGGGKTVLIDPIDGSKNAISGIPFYGASIAVADGQMIKDIELSYVLNLINGDEFWAKKGEGAFLGGRQLYCQKDTGFRLIAYESQTASKDIPKLLPLLRQAHKSRCLGATALDLAYLSAGGISVFVSASPSRGFDFGGGWLLIKEAGGIFTDIKGNSLDAIELSLKRVCSILASGNIFLHEKALKLLQSS